MGTGVTKYEFDRAIVTRPSPDNKGRRHQSSIVYCFPAAKTKTIFVYFTSHNIASMLLPVRQGAKEKTPQ